MHDRLRRARQGNPLGETKPTDALTADHDRAREQVRDQVAAPVVSTDAQVEVAPGESVRGGNGPGRRRR